MLKRLLLLMMLVLGAGIISAQDATETEQEPVTLRESAPNPDSVTFEVIADGFNNPLQVVSANDESGRLFVLEQSGRIFIVQNGVRLETPFLNLSNIVSQDVLRGYSERGLLGLAFHPNYAENGLFFVNYTDGRGTSYLVRYQVSDDPNVADANSAVEILSQTQPFPNHNGGHIAFGKDGYLYVAFGDGGAAGDPLLAGQDLNTWLGKILRIDINADTYTVPTDNPFVDTANTQPEIWAYGLRNPWRFSIDRVTGDVYIADVGQNQWEEVNFQSADSVGGENYGWNVFEASQPYASGTAPANMVYPIAEYNHSRDGECSVTGGFVYRGEALPDMQGAYFFGDFCNGKVWASYRDLNGEWQTNLFTWLQGRQISSFGEDDNGELYIVDYQGNILKMVSAE